MTKRQKRGLVFLFMGILLVLSALAIHLMQIQEDLTAGKMADTLLEQLDNEKIPLEEDFTDRAMPAKTYGGFPLIGKISIPSVGIELPVLRDWDEIKLRAAPCRFEGTLSEGNLIIMGHNTKHHFTPLLSVQPGAEVNFENTLGDQFSFRVAKIEYLKGNEGEHLPSDNYPLTLFTCTPSGLKRMVVRCEKTETTK